MKFILLEEQKKEIDYSTLNEYFKLTEAYSGYISTLRSPTVYRNLGRIIWPHIKDKWDIDSSDSTYDQTNDYVQIYKNILTDRCVINIHHFLEAHPKPSLRDLANNTLAIVAVWIGDINKCDTKALRDAAKEWHEKIDAKIREQVKVELKRDTILPELDGVSHSLISAIVTEYQRLKLIGSADNLKMILNDSYFDEIESWYADNGPANQIKERLFSWYSYNENGTVDMMEISNDIGLLIFPGSYLVEK